jgi:hypothetical protein
MFLLGLALCQISDPLPWFRDAGERGIFPSSYASRLEERRTALAHFVNA